MICNANGCDVRLDRYPLVIFGIANVHGLLPYLLSQIVMLIEGQGSDGYPLALRPHLRVQRRAVARQFRGYVPHGDRASDRRSKAPGGHAADGSVGSVIGKEQRARSDGTKWRLHAGAPTARPVEQLRKNHVGSWKSARTGAICATRTRYSPLESRFHRGGIEVDVLSVQTQSGLQAQGVPCAETRQSY